MRNNNWMHAPWVNHATFWENDVERLQATFVQRNGVLNKRAEHIQHRGHADCLGGIEVVIPLLGSPSEVNRGTAGLLAKNKSYECAYLCQFPP